MGDIERVHRLGSLPSLPRIGDRQRERHPDPRREQREDTVELSESVEEPAEAPLPEEPPIPVEEPYRIDLEA